MSDENVVIPEVEALVDQLFTNGRGEKAVRLVLEMPDQRDGGGWCRKAAADRIAAAFARAEAHVHTLESELAQARQAYAALERERQTEQALAIRAIQEKDRRRLRETLPPSEPRPEE